MRRLHGAALLVAVLAGAVSATAQESATELEAVAERAFDLLNEARREAGLDALRWDPTLASLARRHSAEQAARGRVGHYSYEFGLSTERRVRIAYPWVPRLAENVARDRTLERLNEGLLRSLGHRRNRLDGEFTHVGIGLARGTHTLYLTEVFVTAPQNGDLDAPLALYFVASPGAYERRDAPLVEHGPGTITVGPPGSDDPEYWTSRGIDAYEEGDMVSAEAAFRRALEIDPDYHYAAYDLARVLVASGNPGEAGALLDRLLRDNPDDLTARATRGNAALLRQEFAAAEADFRAVLAARPTDAASWYGLGLALEYQDRPSEAESAYRQALHHDPGLRPAQVGLARVRRR